MKEKTPLSSPQTHQQQKRKKEKTKNRKDEAVPPKTKLDIGKILPEENKKSWKKKLRNIRVHIAGRTPES